MSEQEKRLPQQEEREIQDKKHEIDKEKDKKRNPWDNQPCALCRANRISKPCTGHGGGGGGSGGG